MKTSEYILALGSNVGDSKVYVQQAVENLKKEFQILGETAYMQTPPSMVKTQRAFVNSGVLIRCGKTPPEVLRIVKNIEKRLGRIQRYRFGPREIDIDIVWWSEGKYRSEDLQIPHAYNNARVWIRRILADLHPRNADYEKVKTMNVQPIQSVADFLRKKEKGEKISVITAYDYSSARILSTTSVDTILVGDTAANVMAGYENTLPMGVNEMIYHAAAVRRGFPDIFITVDMPFLSYQVSVEEAVLNAGRLVRETGAQAVKLEGGEEFLDVIRSIRRASIPVMGHLGLLPQSILQMEGYKLQARTEEQAEKIVKEAKMLEEAGVFAIVLEMLPAQVAKKVSEAVKIPTIGIGAGPYTDGQVLVYHDLLGFNPDFSPKFVRKYADLSGVISQAVENFAKDVREQKFPEKKEYFE